MSLWQRLISLPLRFKLLSSVIVAGLVALGLAVYTLAQYDQAIPTVTTTLLRQMAQERQYTINSVFDNHRKSLTQTASSQGSIVNFTLLNQTPGSPVAISNIQTAFRQVLNADPTVHGIRYVAQDGRVLVSVPDVGNRDDADQRYYTTLRNSMLAGVPTEIFVGQIVPQPSPSVDMAAVVVGSNKLPLGFLVTTLDLTGIADPGTVSVFGGLRAVETQPYPFVFYLLGSNATLTAPGRQPVTETPATRAGVLQLFASQPDKPFQFVSPMTGQLVFGVTDPVEGTPLTLVAEIPVPQSAFTSEGGRFLLPLFGLLVVGLLLIGLVGLLIDITVARPAETLVLAANRAAQGRSLDRVEQIAQRDELGELFTAFNSLAELARGDARSAETVAVGQLQNLEATRDLGLELSRLHDQESVLNETLRFLPARFAGLGSVQVFLLDQRNDLAVLHAALGEVGQSRLEQGYRLPLDGNSVIANAINDRQPVLIHEAPGAESRMLPTMRAELALPLIVDGDVIGALDLQSDHLETFSDAEIRLFQVVAEQLGTALHNSHLFDEVRAKLHEIETLNRQLIGEAWQDYVTTRQGHSPVASSGATDTPGWSETQRRAAETGEIVESVGAELVTFAVPVSLRGEVLGAVEWDIPRMAYTENARQLARELAGRLAISADNARLFEQAQRVAQRERLVNEIAGKLVQQTDVTEILKVAVREVGQALRVPQTSIRLAAAQDPDAQ